MTIIRCPRCRDEVTAPAKASPRAIVRCPLCLDEYLLSEALRQLPPELIVIGGAGEPEPAYAGASAAEAAPDYQLAGGGVFDASAGEGLAAPMRPATKGARPRRKQGSGLGMLVGVVFGGVAGISLAVLLLWWVFKTDIGVGPTVAKYVPWIVPEQFHGESGASGDGSAIQSASAGMNSRAATNGSRKAGGPKNETSVAPASGTGELQMLPEPGALPGAPNPLAIDPGAALIGENPLASKPAAGNVDLGALDPGAPLPTPAPTVPAPTVPAPTVPAPPVGEPGKAPDLTNLIPANTPPAPAVPPAAAAAPPTAEEFKDAVIKVADAMARYDASGMDDAEARRAKFTDMYVAVADAGRLITHFSVNDPDLGGMVAELKGRLDSLAGNKGKLSAVRYLASSHWKDRKAGDGLLAAGVVKDLKAAGAMFEVTFDAVVRDMTLTIPVVTYDNPQDLCHIDDELVLVGRIVDDPKTNLRGYEGAAARVLLFGYAVKTP
jgi:hypothetical protein